MSIKKFSLLTLILLIILNVNSSYGSVSELKVLIYSIDFSYPKVEKNNNSFIIKIVETNSVSESSNLPFYTTTFSFPLGTKIVEVSCSHSKPKEIHLDGELYKIRMDEYITNRNYQKVIWDYIKSRRESKSGWFSYRCGCGLEDGEHKIFLTIHLYPIRYENYTIEFVDHMEVQVTYITSNQVPKEDIYDLLIISPSKFIETIQPLVDHKNNIGLPTKLVSLNEIYNGSYFPVEGRDDAEKIKYFIKNSLDNWGIRYVLLIGSIDKLPIRETWIGRLTVLTDLYYADLYDANHNFCSWDTNNNNYFGEYRHGWVDDYVDLYPDVHIGRIPCQSNRELEIVINKIISYERDVNKEWFTNIVLCGGDTHPHYGVYEGEVTVDEIKENLPAFTPIELLTSKNTFNPQMLNKMINNGAGFVAYSGHGFEYGIGTHPPNSEKWIFYFTPYLLGLHNKGRLPVIFFDACLTARLDYTLGDILGFHQLSTLIPCFAWCFVRKTGGGAIATIGATRVAYTFVNEDGVKGGSGYLSLQFFKAYHNGVTVGEMLVSAENNYLDRIWNDPLTLEEMILIGDPSLPVGR